MRLQIPAPVANSAAATAAYATDPTRSGIARRRKSRVFSMSAWGTFDTVLMAKTTLITSMTR